MQYQLGALAACVAAPVYVFLRRYRKVSTIRDVPGPVNPSWIFGTSPEGQPGPFALLLGVDCADREHATRTPVVFPGRRGWGGREEVPRGFREHHPLERSVWGAYRILPNKRR